MLRSHKRGNCKAAAPQKIDDFDASSQDQQAGPEGVRGCADETMPEWAGEEARRKVATKGRFINPAFKQVTKCASEAQQNQSASVLNDEDHSREARPRRKIDLAKLQQADCHLFECRVNNGAHEFCNCLASFEEYFSQKWIDPSKLEESSENLKKSGKTIATLNGSFDLLHAGHLHMIYEASLQADLLIMALNSDSSIKKYKSPLRPIVPLEYRLRMIAALEFVDYVTTFEETDPCVLLSKIKPHVHVNGAEYGANCIEADVVKSHGGRIHIVELVPGLSTSSLIKKIVTTCV
jgi:rfaE bifunctional protein nucleotidyltransferase chain/domain